ncbi:MAG: serine protease [Planctomycetaceae bacterium]|nr:serine protease [Planctomycetaceae bacterium]|tara:strand:+ start:5014 stop:6015 length:1002 start_codon:yes stop_codon:yes gene_type:complete
MRHWFLTGLALLGLAMAQTQAADFSVVSAGIQPKMVKIYGAGGIRGLEGYQSGFLISGEGHILTVWSYVLDTDYITVTLDDGRKYQGEIVGADPRLEIAILKIETDGLESFKLSEAVSISPGARILTFSNLFKIATGDEPNSVLHGIVAATTPLNARRGAFKTTYKGPVYVLDAITNNPGAAGGALTTRNGELAGLLGKELRNSQNGTWLNYAVPIHELTDAVEDILAGRTRPRSLDEDAIRPDVPHTLKSLGIHMVPDVLAKTPPFVDSVSAGSEAEKKGIRPDDLILYVNDRRIDSCATLNNELELVDQIDDVTLVIHRDDELIEVVLQGQ